MKKDLLSIVAGIGFAITTLGFSYVGYNLIINYQFEKKEKAILGISLASLVTLGYCINKANKEEEK